MLKIVESKEDLLKALDSTQACPELLFIHCSIEVQLKNSFPEAQLSLWLYEKDSGEQLWISFRESDTCHRYVCIGAKLGSNFEDSELFQVFSRLEDKYPTLFVIGHGSVVFAANPTLEIYKRWINQKTGHENEFIGVTQQYFYMTEEQKESILKLNLELPDGYHFANIDIEKDSEEITSITSLGNHRDLAQNRAMLEHMPYVMLRKNISNELVAFELVDPIYILRNQFTHENHRGKGLGNFMERFLAQKIIRDGKTPYKVVIATNKPVIDASQRSQYWTRLENNENIIEVGVVRSYKPLTC
uniref:Glycine N-acyltransferase-like protein n=1 Tax=Acrobeloides nanus TaxID=290746 RepID=A0A914CU22_9BILA